jgi:hypothetical protein
MSAMSIKQWCEKWNYSLPTFYAMQRAGTGPEVVRPLGAGGPRISEEVDREWVERTKKLRASKKGQRETERKVQLAKQAAKIATESPLHLSNVRRGNPPGIPRKVAHLNKVAPPAEPKRPKLAAVTPVAPGSSR